MGNWNRTRGKRGVLWGRLAGYDSFGSLIPILICRPFEERVNWTALVNSSSLLSIFLSIINHFDTHCVSSQFNLFIAVSCYDPRPSLTSRVVNELSVKILLGTTGQLGRPATIWVEITLCRFNDTNHQPSLGYFISLWVFLGGSTAIGPRIERERGFLERQSPRSIPQLILRVALSLTT